MNNNYSYVTSNGPRGSNSTNQVQFDPFMLGGSRGFCVGTGPVAQPIIIPPQQYMPAVRSSSVNSYNPQTTSVRDCMQWPSSVNPRKQSQYRKNTQMATHYKEPRSSRDASGFGDYQYCSAPPKVYLSTPGIEKQLTQQNIPCHVAPLGTDPMSMIKPLAPLTVRVQAPADLFAGKSSEPRTIAISPAQLYGSGRQ